MAGLKVSKNIPVDVWQNNRSVVMSVCFGESNSREITITLFGVNKERISLPSINASVTMYIKTGNKSPIGYAGKVIDAENGVISFVFKNGMFPYAGDFPCFVSVIYDNTDLRFGVMTLRVLDTDSTGYSEAVTKNDAFFDCLSRVSHTEDVLERFIQQGTEDAGQYEVIEARGDETILGVRLDKIESGARLNKESVGLETLMPNVTELFLESSPAPQNIYDDSKTIKGQYYNGGKLYLNSYIDSMFFDVKQGDKISASGFKLTSKYSTVGGGVRLAYFNGDVWVKDLTAPETYNKDFVVVPDGVTRVSVPYWIDDTNRSFYNYGYQISAIEKINKLSKDVYKTEIIGKNYYNETSADFIKGKYYSGGVLQANSVIDSMIFNVTPEDKISASGFKLTSKYSTVGGGVRLAYFNGDVWVKDLTAPETYNKDFVVVPDGVTRVSVPYWIDDTNRSFYNLSSLDTEERTISAIKAVENAEKRIDALALLVGGIVGELLNKKVCIYGDSISTFTGYNPAGNLTRYPLSGTLTDVNKTWWKQLIDNNGATLGVNESWAGIRVAWNGTTTNTYQGVNVHLAAQARIDKLGINGTPDYIFVFGGTNDVDYREVPVGTFDYSNPINYDAATIATLPVNTFAAAYRTMLIRLMKTYPKTKIVCILPLYTAVTDGENLDKYNEVIKEACDFFGVSFIDLRTAGITMFNRSMYQPDGVHPNDAGMELIYKCIQKHI